MCHSYSIAQEQLTKFLSTCAVFIHYPYPVERPYDADYILTATFATETAVLVEFNESDLLVVWGGWSFRTEGASGYLYTQRALLCRPSGKVHIFHKGITVFEHVTGMTGQGESRRVTPAPNANEQAAVVIRSWFSQKVCKQILLEDTAGRTLHLWSGAGQPLSLLQPRPRYLLLMLGDVFCLLLGQATICGAEDERLCLEVPNKLVHTRLINENSPLVTADSGKLILAGG